MPHPPPCRPASPLRSAAGLLALLPVAACTGDLDLVLDESSRELPRATAGALLLAALDEGEVRVFGTLTDGVTYDLDAAAGADRPFEFELVGGDGRVLYRAGIPGPVQVQEFLAVYTEPYGVDAIELFPQLGWFPLFVPRLDGAAEVRFYLRDEEGDSSPAGVYALASVDSQVVDADADGPEVTGTALLWESGPPERRLDMVILGDGYTGDQMDRFHRHADRVAEEILGREPFATYASALNIWRVDTPSHEEGASFDCVGVGACVDDWTDNALGSIFPVAFLNGILGTSYSDRAVFQMDQHRVARAAAHVPFDSVLVLVNTPKDGGFAVYYATTSTDMDRFDEVATHEIGHSFGYLGDEYVADVCVVSPRLKLPPNISEWADGVPPWSAWIDPETPLPTDGDVPEETVGMFEGAFNCPDLFRPRATCKMKTNYEEFCPVCREALVRRLYDFVDPIESTEPTVVAAGPGWDVSVSTLHSDMAMEWTLDGTVIQETETAQPLRLDARGLAPGEHVLKLRVADNTPWVRGYSTELTDEAWWRFTR